MAAAAQGQGVVKVELQLRLQVKGLDVVGLQIALFTAGPAAAAVEEDTFSPDLAPAGRSRRPLGQLPPESGHLKKLQTVGAVALRLGDGGSRGVGQPVAEVDARDIAGIAIGRQLVILE